MLKNEKYRDRVSLNSQNYTLNNFSQEKRLSLFVYFTFSGDVLEFSCEFIDLHPMVYQDILNGNDLNTTNIINMIAHNIRNVKHGG